MTQTCRFPMHKDQVKAICILLVYHSSKILPYSRGIFGAVHTNLRSVYGPLGIVF